MPPSSGGDGLLGAPSRARGTRWYGASVALAYMTLAVTLLCFNKAALSSYRFPAPDVLTLAQLCVSNVLLFALRRANVIAFVDADADPDPGVLVPAAPRKRPPRADPLASGSPRRTPPPPSPSIFAGFPTRRTFRATAPLAAAYVAYMSLSMLSVRGVNLPMYTTLRRTTAAFTMLAEYALAGKTQPPAVARAVAVTCVGAALAGAADASFDAKGYALVFACNAATAAYLACIARVGKRTGLNAFGLMWCNGVMAAPVLAAVALLDGDAAKAAAYVRRSAVLAETDFEEAAAAAATGLVPGSGSGSGVAGSVASPSPYPGGGPGPGGLFFALVLASCALAFGLNYAIFLNTAVNSALTQTVCGNLKDVAVIAIGFNAFGGVRVDPRNVAGMGLGILGSIMYAREKLRAPTRGAKAT